MEFDSAIRGHHIYKEIWPNPNIGEQLHCKMEHGNTHDMYAVAVTRNREDIQWLGTLIMIIMIMIKYR